MLILLLILLVTIILIGTVNEISDLTVSYKSKLSFEDTIAAIVTSAGQAGWNISAQHELHKSVAKEGYEVLPVTMIELCKPSHAYLILKEDNLKHFTPLMPCRISVYQMQDGSTHLSMLNYEPFLQSMEAQMGMSMRQTMQEMNSILFDITA